jgi:hypothetical protein
MFADKKIMCVVERYKRRIIHVCVKILLEFLFIFTKNFGQKNPFWTSVKKTV